MLLLKLDAQTAFQTPLFPFTWVLSWYFPIKNYYFLFTQSSFPYSSSWNLFLWKLLLRNFMLVICPFHPVSRNLACGQNPQLHNALFVCPFCQSAQSSECQFKIGATEFIFERNYFDWHLQIAVWLNFLRW